MSPSSANKVVHYGFENQRRRPNRGISGLTKRTCVLQKFEEINLTFVSPTLQQSSYDGDFSRELERVGARMTPDDDGVVPNLRRVPSLSDLSEEGSLGMYPV